MPNYRRARTPGAAYFFTVVTDGRRPILASPAAVALLRRILGDCRARWPFTLDAIVVLPDHLHAIWTLPHGDAAYPARWGWIKKQFTKEWRAAGGIERVRSLGRTRDARRGVWQPRYWEHEIRDDRDFATHLDYVHYNPVQHGYARCAHEWRASSFRRHVRAGDYDPDYDPRWACCCDGRRARIDLAAVRRTVGE